MKIVIRLFMCIILIISIFGCAKRASPTGGPKDSIPPVLINASPKLNTTYFNKTGFTLTFDEYVSLNEISKQLIISPPLNPNQYKVLPASGASKKISLELKDSLLDNTTYTFNFGNSVVDFNESNTLPFLTYTISTGPIIDTLYIRGRVVDAFEKDTKTFISLQLYPVDSVYNDSVIYNKKPLYVTSTLDSTTYKFQNLREGKYNLIALQDVSGNYFFDQSSDKIGYSNRLIELPKDSIINLRLFHERENFSWVSPYFINDHHVALAYFGDYENETFSMISEVPKEFEFLVTKNREMDSLNYWFRGAKLDSIKFEFEILDTLRTKTAYLRKPIEDSLVIKSVTTGPLKLKSKFEISSNLPIVSVDSTFVKVINVDSVNVPVSLKVLENYDRILIDFEVLPNDKYNITLLPKALEDFWGRTNDTLTFNTPTKKVEDYGNIYLRVIHNLPHPYIIELIQNKKVIRRYDSPIEGGLYSFELLDPGKYFVRLIEDPNNNKKWDTGSYLGKVQPEKVIYYWKEIDLRANWDINETFNVNQNYPYPQEKVIDYADP